MNTKVKNGGSFLRKGRRRVGIDCSLTGAKNLVEQEHRDDCDIHTIMRKAKTTGVVQHVNKHKGDYLDMVGAPDFEESQRILAKAQSLWEDVPSHIRKEFDNDYGKYADFMMDPDNRDAITDLGLDASHLPEQESSSPAPDSASTPPSPEPEISSEAPQSPSGD